MLFHLGALTRLNELGLLAQTGTIGAIGGGSIVAAVLAGRVPWPLQGAFREWPERVVELLRELTRRDLRARSLLRLPRGPRGTAFEESYARRLTAELGGESEWGPRFVFGVSGLTLSGLAAGWEEGLEWSLLDSSPGGYDATLVAEALAALRPDLAPLGRASAAALENHGYLLADAAVRRSPGTAAALEPLPPLPPHPQWLDPERVRAAVAGARRSRRHRRAAAGGVRPEGPTRGRSAELSALLARHRPLLVYDSLECCRAGSAAAICSLARDGRANSLHRADGTFLATAGAVDGPRLDLDFLGRTYGDGGEAREDDYLDESGASLAADALAQRDGEGQRADLVYGRAIRAGDGTVRLQYWLCFYFSDRGHLGIEQHEGGWELVQLRLGAGGRPEAMTVARPGGGLLLGWDELETATTADGEVAVVYPARGSHAPLPEPGTFAEPAVPAHNDGAGPRLRPRLVEIGDDGPGWVFWPGRWGATRRREFFEGESPRGPGARREWRQPERFESSAVPWSGEPFDLGPPPAAPQLRVRYEGEGAAAVEYRFTGADEPGGGAREGAARQDGAAARPTRLVAAPVAADGTVGPALAIAAHPLAGSFTLRLPRGRDWSAIRIGTASALAVPGPTTTAAIAAAEEQMGEEGERAG